MSGILVFEGLDAVYTGKAQEVASRRSVQWISHNGVPLKPTKERKRQFRQKVRETVASQKLGDPRAINEKIASLNASTQVLKADIVKNTSEVAKAESEVAKMSDDKKDEAKAEAVARSATVARDVAKVVKYETAIAALRMAQIEPRERDRNEMVTYAYAISELPTVIKVPKTSAEEDAIISSQSVAKEMIATRGQFIRSLRRRLGIKYVPSTYSISMSGFGSLFGGVKNYFQDLVNETAGAVKTEVVDFAQDTTREVLDKGQEHIASLIPDAPAAGTLNTGSFLSRLGAGTGLLAAASSKLSSRATGGTTAPSTTVSSGSSGWAWLIPVAVIGGGVVIVTRIFK